VKHEVEPVQLVVVRIRIRDKGERLSVARRQEFGLSGRHGDHRRTVLLGQQFDQPVHKRPPLERQRLRFVKNYHAPHTARELHRAGVCRPGQTLEHLDECRHDHPRPPALAEGGDVLDGVVGD